MSDELGRRREECIQLRTLLSVRTRQMSDIANESYGGNTTLLNEDGELEMAYKSQKDLNKLVNIILFSFLFKTIKGQLITVVYLF